MPKGIYKRTERHREKIREAQNRPEVKAKRRETRNDPAVRAAISRKIKDTHNTPEARRMKSIKAKEAWGRPEVRSVQAKKIREAQSSLEYQEKHKAVVTAPEHREKMSRISTEVWQRPGHREKVSGENGHNWYGGIADEPYGPGDAEKLKEQIRKRDGHTCQLCGRPWTAEEKKFPAHHIDYNKKNHVMWNRITLCPTCHGKTADSRKREYWMAVCYEIVTRNCLSRILDAGKD